MSKIENLHMKKLNINDLSNTPLNIDSNKHSKSSSDQSQPEIKSSKNIDQPPLEALGINVFELESMNQNNFHVNNNHLESGSLYYGLGYKKNNENTELQNFLQSFNSSTATKKHKNANLDSNERSTRSQLNSRFGIKGKENQDEKTRNIFRNRIERSIFKSQEKQEENNLRLIDVEKFLLKVTSKRQANTPSMSVDRNTQMSYIPPCVIKKCTEANLQKEHINILTGIKKKAPFFSNLNLDKKTSNLKSESNSYVPPTIRMSENWKNFMENHNLNKIMQCSQQFLHLPHLYN